MKADKHKRNTEEDSSINDLEKFVTKNKKQNKALKKMLENFAKKKQQKQ